MSETDDIHQLEHLLARTALGDRQAFERLYRTCAPHLYGLVLRTVRERELASDVLQECFVKIWRNAANYRTELARPMTWMGTIARNQAIDALRRRGNRPRGTGREDELLAVVEESPGPLQNTAQAERDRQVHYCLGQLEGRQREAMTLAYFHDLTHEELAERMQTPLGTVKSWIRRGLMRLKQCLESL